MIMGPCAAGAAGLRHMQRGMDSTREIVRNNILRRVSRRRPTNLKRKKLKLFVSLNDRKRASILSKRTDKRSFSCKFIFSVSLMALVIGALFLLFHKYFILVILFLAIPYLFYQILVLAKKSRPYINNKMRNSHIKKHKVNGLRLNGGGLLK